MSTTDLRPEHLVEACTVLRASTLGAGAAGGAVLVSTLCLRRQYVQKCRILYRAGPKGPQRFRSQANLFCTAPLQLLSSSGQIATVVAHSTVKVPCNNIKAVALGGYVCTICRSSTGVPPKVA